MDEDLPLVIDLDGTLIKSDMLLETVLEVLRRSPWAVFAMPFWLARGRAAFKRQVAMRAGALSPESLPYRHEILDWLRAERLRGRRVVLATASDEQLARRIAEHLDAFDEVVASDGRSNLKGPAKRAALVARYGERGFDYAGDAKADLAVWSSARRAIVVSGDAALIAAAARASPESRAFPAAVPGPAVVARALRLHQWPKNLLVFVPLITAHRVNDPGAVLWAAVAFLAFGLVASSIYIVNDLLDLTSDRAHATKRARPFAAGDLGIAWGMALFPLLLLAGLGVAALAGPGLAAVVACYAVLGILYSAMLKRFAVIDVLLIATFYALRIVGGAVAIGVVVSNFLFAFGLAVFISLALAKRHGELMRAAALGGGAPRSLPGRGYRSSHLAAVGWLGTASGLASAVVFALYITSPEVTVLYRQPEILWVAATLHLLWVARLWRRAHRGRLEEDPLSFALHDPASYAVAALSLAAVYLAT
jgi:4-hydroxybenzoate polyprenyltransferase/phosphoserine phosphatase